MDFCDLASSQERMLTENSIKKALHKPRMEVTGYCYNCGDKCKNKLFCCPECRDDYELRKKSEELSGNGKMLR